MPNDINEDDPGVVTSLTAVTAAVTTPRSTRQDRGRTGTKFEPDAINVAMNVERCSRPSSSTVVVTTDPTPIDDYDSCNITDEGVPVKTALTPSSGRLIIDAATRDGIVDDDDNKYCQPKKEDVTSESTGTSNAAHVRGRMSMLASEDHADLVAAHDLVTAQLVEDSEGARASAEWDEQLKPVEATIVRPQKYVKVVVCAVICMVVVIGVGVGLGARSDAPSATSSPTEAFTPTRTLSPLSQTTARPTTELENGLAVLTEFLGFTPTSEIRAVNAFKREFNGTAIPSEIGLLSSLEIIRLEDNGLTGPIPTELAQLTLLTTMTLADDAFTGQIPSEILRLTRLELLQIISTSLTGTVGTEIGLLTSLESLWLADNRMSGPLPKELGSLTSLTLLALYDQLFTGPIPSDIASLTSLRFLDLAFNELLGPVPSELGLLPYLKFLTLSNNQLSHQIPTELGLLTSLTWLDLASNKLTGKIPSELGLLTMLTYLNLTVNEFTGTVPFEIFDLNIPEFAA